MDIKVLDIQKKFRINKARVKKITAKFLKYLNQDIDCILNLTFVSPGEIKQLNKKYFKKENITDVIAIEPGEFNKDIYGAYLGDIIICPQKAKENSKRFNKSIEEEIFLYVAHGILHLLHYSDSKIKGRTKMEKKQKELLAYCYEKG